MLISGIPPTLCSYNVPLTFGLAAADSEIEKKWNEWWSIICIYHMYFFSTQSTEKFSNNMILYLFYTATNILT